VRFGALALTATFALPVAFAQGEPARRPAEPRSGDRANGYTAEKIRATIEEHVQQRVQESGGGVYPLPDDATGKTLQLEFVHVGVVSAGALWTVHDPDRPPEGRRGSFVACVLFHPVGAPPEKVYDVDVQVEPLEGKLAVTEVRIHKEMQLVNGEWTWVPRPAAKQGRGPSKAP
jgi:hypothetical protein